MLIKLPEWLSRNKNLIYPHRGRVVANADPLKRGRIKVVIEKFLTVSDIQNKGYKLPWIYPDTPYFLGGSSSSISFSVPELNSYVTVIFPFEDIYFGFYRNHWSTLNIPAEFNEDYPNSFGWKDSTGTYQKVNKTQQYVEFFHVSGARVRLYNDGMFEIFTPGKIDFVNSDDIDIETQGDTTVNATGKIVINATGKVTIDGQSDIDILSASKVKILAGGNTEIENKIFLLHTHTGVESGLSNTGPVS
jgi:hypothetical protein